MHTSQKGTCRQRPLQLTVAVAPAIKVQHLQRWQHGGPAFWEGAVDARVGGQVEYLQPLQSLPGLQFACTRPGHIQMCEMQAFNPISMLVAVLSTSSVQRTRCRLPELQTGSTCLPSSPVLLRSMACKVPSRLQVMPAPSKDV